MRRAPLRSTAVRSLLVAVLLPSLACTPGRTPHPTPNDGPAPVADAQAATAATACALPPAAAPEAERRAARNLDDGALATCGTSPMTGVYRDGRCATGPDDAGVHVVCARVTEEFLAFTRERGNDLVSARGSFPGLRAGDRWCLCASRWAEAEQAGVAPPVDLAATEAQALRFVSRDTLARHALR
ncbi:MAG: DUF2237 domain-containing protein [Deltaproteobacteria bacterium]|nr:DUF2237 domain-containing protein [Deltaproteobacteria bacterium]